MPERSVVGPRKVPGEVDGDPERQRDERVREDAPTGQAGERCRESRSEPGDAERGRPFREDHVLEQVHGEEVMERDRLDRREEDGEDQELAGGEGRDPDARRGEPAQGGEVGEREPRHEPERFGVPPPLVRTHAERATGIEPV